jgi:sugar phosphate isomerase/epimerase
MAGLVVAGLAAAQTPPAPAPRGQPPVLGIDGPRFTVDGTPRFLLVVSYFDALRASDATLEADFAWLRRHGIDGVRIFPNWWRCTAVRQCGGHAGDDTLMAAPDGALRPAVLARLKAVLAAAGRHGLIVDLSFARETVRDTQERELSPSAYADALVAAVRALGPLPHVMIDLQNEVYQNRVFAEAAAADASRVAALAKRVDGGARTVFVSTNTEEAERYTYCGVDGCPLDVLAVHDAREPNWHDRTPAVVRELVALGARRGPRPVYLQEPQAWQDERAPDRVERFLDAAARASRAGAAAWTFHTRSAFILREGRSLASQVDADERKVLEGLRQRVDARPAAR